MYKASNQIVGLYKGSIAISGFYKGGEQGSLLDLGLVSDAWIANNASTQKVYYQKNGVDNELDGIVSISNELLSNYSIGIDNGGFAKCDQISIGALSAIEHVRKNADSQSGTWALASPPNIYTSQIGATDTFSFSGTKISMVSLGNTSGGLWSCVIDDGDPIVISVWNSVTEQRIEQLIADDLTDEDHTLVRTFMGEDPDHPVASPRGWSYEGDEIDTGTFITYTESYLEERALSSPYSNIEFAPLVRKLGESYDMTRFPYHGTDTTNVDSLGIFVDGIQITDFSVDILTECQNIEVRGVYTIINTNDPTEELLTVTTLFRIDKYGYSVAFTFTAIQDTEISDYCFMLPIHREFGTLLSTNLPETYDLTDSDAVKDFLTNGNSVRSFKATSDLSGCTNYQLTAAFKNLNVLRLGETDRGYDGNPDNIIFIDNRNSTTLNKVYCLPYYNSVLLQGESIKFENVYYAGCIS